MAAITRRMNVEFEYGIKISLRAAASAYWKRSGNIIIVADIGPSNNRSFTEYAGGQAVLDPPAGLC
jgi:hypothetical protein